MPFDPKLSKTLQVGMAISAHNPSKISEARFNGLEIQKVLGRPTQAFGSK